MITVIAPKNQVLSKNSATAHWQKALAQAIRDPHVLIKRLQLSTYPEVSLAAHQAFRVLVPESYLRRMVIGDQHDPLLRQVLPIAEEMQEVAGFSIDPVEDNRFSVATGILQKYQGRALLITTGACAIHCRYCFRRHFPYQLANAAQHEWQTSLAYLAQHHAIEEVILSGGDPLTLTEQRLQGLSDGLKSLPHIKRLRIHTRLPVVLPERVNHAFLQWLEQCQQQVIVVLHINHAQELAADDVQQALALLRGSGVTLLNQAVLLKGVNNNVASQVELSEALFRHGVLPYYLHVLDKVAGAAHFYVDDEEALTIVAGVRAAVSGYLVPRLVREQAGEVAKMPLV